MAVGTLSTRITSQLQSLQGLHLRLREIGAYLQKVLDGELPVNHAILGNLQDVFNLLPNLSAPKEGSAAGGKGAVSELSHAMGIKTNDQLMAIYLSSLIRAITAFHDLIENKVQNKQHDEEKEREKEGGGAEKKEAEKKEGEKKKGEEKQEEKGKEGEKEKERKK